MKKVCGFIRNCVENYIPMAAFVVLFVVFVFQIFMRYVVTKVWNVTVPWTIEVEQSCFLWLVMLGACYAQRVKGHVTFTLLYDNLGVKGKAITAMLGNILISFTTLVTFLPTLNYIWGLTKRHQVTSILKIPKVIVFFPYIFFLVIMGAYALVEIYEEIMVLRGDKYYTEKMLAETKSEAEQAVEESLAQEQLDLNNIDYEGKEDK